MSNDVRALVLDLTDTSYIDSYGISLIFDAAARLRNRRQQLRLVVPPGSFVGEVLSAVSIEESVPIDPALSDALEAVGGLVRAPLALDHAQRVATDLKLVAVGERAPVDRLPVDVDAVHRAVVEDPELALRRLDDDGVSP